MNSAARLLYDNSFSPRSLVTFCVSARGVAMTVLFSMLFATAFSTIYVTNQIRSEYHAMQSMEQQSVRLHERGDQLVLEKSAWSSQSRIAHIANERLHMVVPRTREKSTLYL
jgi:cell division protein FtsL